MTSTEMLDKRSEADKTVFVGNLDSSVKEEILFELFLQAGPLKKVTIARDREGRQRSYGFVCYKHREAVPYAIALLNGTWLYGRPIRLQYRSGSSHSDGGAGPSDPPCEPHSTSTVFPESSMFQFSGLPEGRGPLQDPLYWNTMVGGYPSQQCPLNIPPPQPQYYLQPSALCPSAPPLFWPASGFPPWTPLPPGQQSLHPQPPGSSQMQLPLPPSPPEGQGGCADDAEHSKPRKRRRSRERRHRPEKHRSRQSADARGHTHAHAHTRGAEDGKTTQGMDFAQ
ncbi:RNA binding motif protein 11 [Megalops cyprinoides]|uniref:RNA binding motif protein 11 n=1 Tax=Megalops cyprinoides TaxID=118141 RepID=UPI001863D1A7|nr:RNA binding motif protein 11 [Megalops cyprinoides]